MLEMKHGFYETDDDCMQCCKELGNNRYLFIQVIQVGIPCTQAEEASDEDADEYVVVTDSIDVSKLSQKEIEKAIYGFYKSISEMEEAYGTDISNLMALVAECQFENIPFISGHDHFGRPVTWETAEHVIQCFINNDGRWEECWK